MLLFPNETSLNLVRPGPVLKRHISYLFPRGRWHVHGSCTTPKAICRPRQQVLIGSMKQKDISAFFGGGSASAKPSTAPSKPSAADVDGAKDIDAQQTGSNSKRAPVTVSPTANCRKIILHVDLYMSDSWLNIPANHGCIAWLCCLCACEPCSRMLELPA